MNVHLYLSLIPEALIASMLTPEEFGVYYAVGTQKRSRGQAVFFELAPSFRTPDLPIDEGISRCVPHEDGSPKRSIYIAVYRAMERISMDAVRKLYLVTQDGRTLGLEHTQKLPAADAGLHLYREIAPVNPLVVSTYGPKDFFELITKKPTSLITLPAVCFTELKLGDLALNPRAGEVGDLPYSNLDHLRDCLVEVHGKRAHSKMVDRIPPVVIPYRTIKNGFFLGNQKKLLYFPMPDESVLQEKYYRWWRSATM